MVNNTPKDPNGNCYTTAVAATAYLGLYHPASTTWAALTSTVQESYLLQATKILDACMSWYGTPRTLQQALQWPRSGVRRQGDLDWYDYDTFPDVITNATAELAYALSIKDRVSEPGLLGKGLSSVSVGALRIQVDPTAVLSLIPAYVLNMLKFVGEVNEISAGATGRIAPLARG